MGKFETIGMFWALLSPIITLLALWLVIDLWRSVRPYIKSQTRRIDNEISLRGFEKLIREKKADYVGGQIVSLYSNELRCAEIEDITIDDGTIRVRQAWEAYGERGRWEIPRNHYWCHDSRNDSVWKEVYGIILLKESGVMILHSGHRTLVLYPRGSENCLPTDQIKNFHLVEGAKQKAKETSSNDRGLNPRNVGA